MALFYRGAGIGTFWHERDPRLEGFTAHMPGADASPNRLMDHITNLTTKSPFVSLTRSYGVAEGYALLSRLKPSKTQPAYVWEIELTAPLPPSVKLIDPVQWIATHLPAPEQHLSYHHDGSGDVLLGLVDPTQQDLLFQPIPLPRGSGGTKKAPNLSLELRTLVRVLRDAEVLAVGAIPASCVRGPYEVY